MAAMQYATPIGPERPAIIAQRHWCPSCDAPAGEPCRLASFPQEYSHVSRHRVAQRALWRAMAHEGWAIETGWTVGRAAR